MNFGDFLKKDETYLQINTNPLLGPWPTLLIKYVLLALEKCSGAFPHRTLGGGGHSQLITLGHLICIPVLNSFLRYPDQKNITLFTIIFLEALQVFQKCPFAVITSLVNIDPTSNCQHLFFFGEALSLTAVDSFAALSQPRYGRQLTLRASLYHVEWEVACKYPNSLIL